MSYREIRSAFGHGQCLENSAVWDFLQNTDPAAWFGAIAAAEKHGTWLNTSVQKLPSATGDTEPVFCKHYPIKRGSQRLLARLGRYKSASVFVLTRKLCDREFPTPMPLAYFICRAGHRDGSFLFTENLDGFTDLRHWAKTGQTADYFSEHHLVARSLELMAELHAAGIVHRDFKFGNLLWHEDKRRLYLIDFDGAKTFSPETAVKPRARDIARFTLACHQVGLSQWSLEKVIDLYREKSGITDQSLLPRSRELYDVLLARHNRKRPVRS